MGNESKKGSAVTAIITALIFALILAIFSRSVQGAKIEPPDNIQSPQALPPAYYEDSGYLHIHVLEEGKHHFIPSLRDME